MPTQLRNSRLARRLAAIYEDRTGKPFPGGPENATIRRTRVSKAMTQNGEVSWWLEAIDESHLKGNDLVPFCSSDTATDCAKNPDWIDVGRAALYVGGIAPRR